VRQGFTLPHFFVCCAVGMVRPAVEIRRAKAQVQKAQFTLRDMPEGWNKNMARFLQME